MEQLRRDNEKKCARPEVACASRRAYAAPLRRYGLSKEYVDSIVLPSPVRTAQTATLERQVQAGGHRAKGKQAKATLKLSMMAASLDTLSDSQRRALLHALHQRLHALLAKGGGAAAPVRAQLLTNTLSTVLTARISRLPRQPPPLPSVAALPPSRRAEKHPSACPVRGERFQAADDCVAPQEARQSWRRWQHRHRLARRHGL
jgi:hypothetical protein